MTTRRQILQGAALSALAALPGLSLLAPRSARAAGWPDKPVKIVVPYPAGGSTDVLSRILAEELKVKFGQPFLIDNRAGAGGNIRIDAVAKSTPDGYTLGAATIGHFSINQYLYSKMTWDADKDLLPVSMTWELPNVAVVPADHVPATTLKDFIAWAKTRPNGISYGSPGIGTTPHLSGVLFCQRAGVKGEHVPFRGAAQTIPAMLSGDVHIAVDNLASYIPFINSGKLRALAVTSAERWPSMPDIPTMAQAGMNDFVVTSWAAFVVPAGTPKEIVAALSSALQEISKKPEIQQKFLTTGAKSLGSTPEVVTARGQKERPMWKSVIESSGARQD
ncbi:tripartite tricarboxylate transporter substrate binding protein [Ferrovibrio terrae]|uniref:Bug family tripartite tricarboxylate transporter substrate binding protein n=1 Tax=Ferrovibrio terrae TaxID=2594003 RepID=UPI003137B822